MDSLQLWRLTLDYWQMGMTMALGSFVAGATPAGGAAVAFPVFTKLLSIGSTDARTFGLMIQSVGMTMASLFIVAQGIPIDWRIIRWGSTAGCLGLILGSLTFTDLGDIPRIVFTSITFTFGIALLFLHWFLRQKHDSQDLTWKIRQRLHFAGIGFVGGVISSMTGSGVDMVLYIVMTLGYGMAERLAVPSTVVAMAIVSIAGFFTHQVLLEDISPSVWGYWVVCAPIVSVGAPFGAWVVSKISRDLLIGMILMLISLDLCSTLWLLKIDRPKAVIIAVTLGFSTIWIISLLKWRKKHESKRL
jgi:uncharacterized membrane protein YfcA